MIRPPRGSWAFIMRTAWCAHRNEPVRLVATIDCQPSSDTSSTAPGGAPVPALFTSRSSRPYRFSTAVNKVATESASVTSVTTGSTVPAAASAAVSSRGVRRRPAAATCQSASASASVMWRPRPEPAPVTTATPLVVMTLTVEPGSVLDKEGTQARADGQRCAMYGKRLLVAVVYVPAIHRWPATAVMPPRMPLPPEPPGLGTSLTVHLPPVSWKTRTLLLSV